MPTSNDPVTVLSNGIDNMAAAGRLLAEMLERDGGFSGSEEREQVEFMAEMLVGFSDDMRIELQKITDFSGKSL